MRFTKALAIHQNWSLIKNLGSDLWTVNSAFIWFLDYDKKDYKIEVEKGMVSDFGSIPKILQNIFNPTKYIIYLAHDKIYKNSRVWRKESKWVLKSKVLTRKECDLVLLEWLKVEWASFIERWLVYIWVRTFWWLCFKK